MKIDYQTKLNKEQFEAVTTPFQNVRVIAGAGSGKTRVLTYRISYLISEENVKPWKILAITFTNKVANEMKNRVVSLIPEAEPDLTIKTFHSFAAYFLRHEISALNYPANFTILDEEDQTKIIKDICAEKGYRRTDSIVAKAIGYISSNKLKEKYPDDIQIAFEKFQDEKVCLEIYEEYEEIKNKQFALDFDDLLLKTNIILENYPLIRSKWQERIDHILIDEFQDTNDVEYRMVKFLCKPSTSLYVVGDPDQTIYTWRGANQNIIMNIDKNFLDVHTVILNRNYRSTQTILDSANKLIGHNKFRVPKDLYTENEKGEEIFVKGFSSSKSEAEFVAREIKKIHISGTRLSDIAILYRSNYVSMEFENAFVASQIPYVIYGGIKFYQRREIKDVLAYFRLINNFKDDISFERIMNVPKRGIGDTSIGYIKKEASEANLSLYEYLSSDAALNSECSNKVINTLRNVITHIEATKKEIEKDEEVLSKILEDLITSIGIYESLIKEDDGDERIENVKNLFADLRNYLSSHPDSTFDEYLQNIALISSQDEMEDADKVTLMTAHTAKGLEYPVVFVVRFNEGVFPHIRSTLESGYQGLEEERRLAYVAMTRAKNKLYLTYADGFSYVLRSNLTASSFIKESGNYKEHFEEHSFYSSPKKPREYHFNDDPYSNRGSFNDNMHFEQDFSQVTNDVDSWEVGDIVIHEKLGRGIVIELEGDGIIKVNFEQHGVKSILGNHRMVSKGKKIDA